MANIKIRTRHSGAGRLVRPRPVENGAFETFVSDADDFRAYVHCDVLAFIKRQAQLAGDDETIGLLAGRICQDPKTGPYTLVMAACGVLDGEFEATESHVKLSATGHAKVRSRLEDAHPDREVVGWYHTHPHHQARFSSVDIDEQATWNDPDQIGIVHSGIDDNEPFGVYRGPRAILLQQRHKKQPVPMPVPEPIPREPHLQLSYFTPRTEPEVFTREPASTHTARRKTLPVVMLCFAVALLLVCLLGDLFWLHHRLSAIEGRMGNSVVTKIEVPTQPFIQPSPASTRPTMPAAVPSPDNPMSGEKETMVKELDLLHPAKPPATEPTARTDKQQRREVGARQDESKKILKKSQRANKFGKSSTQTGVAKTKKAAAQPQDAVPKASQSPPPR